MPIVTIAYQQQNSEDKVATTQSGGCFGFMAGSGFFHSHYRDSKYVAYHLESKGQADRCKAVFKNNKLFPFHKFMTPSEWNAFLEDNDFNDQRHGTSSMHGYVVIEMQPEGYEDVGIPQDMFISGLFTARQLSYNSFDRWLPALAKGVHPMIAYVIAEIVTAANMGEALTFRLARQSSSNVDTTKFGKLNFINLIKYLKGDEDAVGYWGHEGGIIQRGRYKRDSQFSQHQDGMTTVWGGTSTLNMNSLIAPIDNDTPIIFAGSFSPLYLAHVLNAHVGKDILDMSKAKAKTDQHGNNADLVKGDENWKFFAETRPRFKKKYKKGQTVEVRADAVGTAVFDGSRMIHSLSRSFNYTHMNDTVHPLVMAGVVPNRTVIEEIDPTRGVECIKLEMGTWVSPRMIKLVGVNEADGLVPVENQGIIQNEIYLTNTGNKVIARTYDMFDGEVRAVRLDAHRGVDETTVRRTSLTSVYR